MNILIITWSEDNNSVELVSSAIQAKGGTVYRFDTDLYPVETMMSAEYVAGKRSLKLKSSTFEIDLNTIDAVWYRRLRVGKNIPKDLEEQLYKASVEESRRTYAGMLGSLGKFSIDPYQKIRYTENKQLQLQLAAEVGLEIPKTLFTNDAEEVLAFYKKVNAPLITKMQHAFAVYEGDEENVVFTNELTEEHLENLEGLELCPMTFQEKIEKQVELRITIVGNQVFTAAIDSNASELAKTDWRRQGNEMINDWQKYELPESIQAKILQLMDRLALNYGAADVIVTPDNRYVFLEVNPSGEFFWLDKLFDGQISVALADVLLGNSPRRTNNVLIEENWV
ncbi:MAG: MvdD family ATP-grasp ribosomal peptide maturase [Flammeovirgaceae bacterium]